MKQLLIVGLLCASLTAAAADDIAHEPQGWLAFFGQKKVAGSPFVFWLDVQARLNQPVTQTTWLLRPGVGLRFRPDMVAWLGYAWTPVVREGAITLDEHRVWQQWTWDVALPLGMKLLVRSRLEERLARGEVGLRFRQFVRVQSPRLDGKPVILAAWDEAFVAFNDTAWGQQAGFDQNRVFGGVGLFLSDEVRLEVGYLNQYQVRRNAPDPMRHVALINVFANW